MLGAAGVEKKYNIVLQSPGATTVNQIFSIQQDSVFDKILYKFGQHNLDQYDGKKIGKGMPWESSWDRRKGTKAWTLFQSKEIIKQLPKGSTRYSSHASFKHEGKKKASVNYSIKDIYTLANREVV